MLAYLVLLYSNGIASVLPESNNKRGVGQHL